MICMLAKEYAEQHLNDLKIPFPDTEMYFFDELSARKPICFIQNFCRHYKGEKAGELFKLLDWEKGYISCLFGYKNKITKKRKYKKSYLQIARKNGKTFLISSIGLYFLLCEKTDGKQEIVLAGSTRDQAAIALENETEFVKADSELRRLIKIYHNKLTNKDTGGILKVLSSDGGGAHGINPTLAIIDELHVHKNKDLYEALVTAQGARSEPLLLVITTAGNDVNSLCYDLYNYSCGVRDGIIKDETFLPSIFELPRGKDWKNQELWKYANPSLGESISLDFLQTEFKRAVSQPSFENSFKQLYLNEWVTSKSSWIEFSKWKECEATIDWNVVEKLPCWIGMDLSSTSDTTAIVAVFRDEQTELAYVKPFIWIPERTLELLRTRSVLPFDLWLEQGYLKKTEGEIINHVAISDFLINFIKTHDVRYGVYDFFKSELIVPKIQECFPNFEFVSLYQSYALLGSKTAVTETAIIDKKLLHDKNPVLDWQINNAVTMSNGDGYYKITKKLSTGKIDAIVSMIMAYGVAVQGCGKGLKSKYETENLLTLEKPLHQYNKYTDDFSEDD